MFAAAVFPSFAAGGIGLVSIGAVFKETIHHPSAHYIISLFNANDDAFKNRRMNTMVDAASYAGNWQEQMDEVIALRSILGSDFR